MRKSTADTSKKKLARKMRTQKELKAGVSIYNTKAWNARNKAKAEKVAKKLRQPQRPAIPVPAPVENDDPVRVMDPETKQYVYVDRKAGRMIKRHGFLPGWRDSIVAGQEPTV